MGTIVQKLDKILDTKEAIRNAIAAKGQTVPEDTAFSAYPEKIAAIQTGVDTSDATVTADKLPSGVIAYGKNGKVVGTVETYIYGDDCFLKNPEDISDEPNGNAVDDYYIRETVSDPVFLEEDSIVNMKIPLSMMGNAGVGDVLYGQTFTSEAGVKVKGTLPYRTSLSCHNAAIFKTTFDGSAVIQMYGAHNAQDKAAIAKGGTLYVDAPASSFGNAAAADVASGKTFTSEAGVKVTGTGKIATKKTVVSVGVTNNSGRAGTLTLYYMDSYGLLASTTLAQGSTTTLSVGYGGYVIAYTSSSYALALTLGVTLVGKRTGYTVVDITGSGTIIVQ